MKNKKNYFIVMASFIGVIILILGILIVSHIIQLVQFDGSLGVERSFYVVLILLEVLALSLFGFVEFLTVKLIRSLK